MLSERGGGNAASIRADAVRDQLQRILSGSVFSHSPQLCRFLRFIVEQEVAGHGEELKEYSLGVHVFGRPESFDPRIDTVVRTEARRLRQKLSDYYQNEGRGDPIEITLPKGTYHAAFQARAKAAPATRSRAVWWAGAALCALLAVGVYAISVRPGSRATTPGGPPAIAVLPLENLSADPEQEYFSDGMTDALITDLAKIGGLRVISRTSVLPLKRTRKPIPEIVRQLGVDYVVEGTILRAGNRLRITAQLVGAAAAGERHVWAESYERDLGDALSLQAEVARAIARQVSVSVVAPEPARPASPAVHPAALDAYLKGRFYWNVRKTDAVRKSVQYFQEAIAKEPGYAQAYAGLSDAYTVLVSREGGNAGRELRARAHAAAMKAVALDDRLGEAQASLAMSGDEWDWPEAERHLRRALELSPSYAAGRQWHAGLLANTGRLEEALAEARLALQLDPLSPAINSEMGWLLYCARRYDEAIRQLRQTVEVFPNLAQAYANLGRVYLAKGMYHEAIEALEKAVELSANPVHAEALLAHARALAGDRRDSVRLSKLWSRREDVSPFARAVLCLAADEPDRALAWLDRGVEERSLMMHSLMVDPIFDGLRRHPRFAVLLRKMRLPAGAWNQAVSFRKTTVNSP